MILKIKRLSFDDFICLEDDINFFPRSEAMKSMDIDGHAEVLRYLGIKPGDHVVDVGAFIGDTAFVFAKHGCSVDAIEPFFDAYVCLVYNTRGWPVRHWNAPAGNGESVALVEDGIGGNLGMRRVAGSGEEASVRTLKVDDLGLSRLSFMKIDCEGSEIPVLMGAAQTIARFKPVLFVEMYREGLGMRGYSEDALSEQIVSMGYTMEMYGSPPRWDWICRPK